MLTNLHPYTRRLSYRGRPDYIEFGGTFFRAFYAGFTDCSGECPKSYEPLFISGWTVCCQGIECLIVSVSQGSIRRPKIKSEPVILFYGLDVNLTASLEWLGDECSSRYQVTLQDYQGFFSTDDLRPLQGFTLEQTTFYDFQNVCLCSEVQCPQGMSWNADECACISNPEECLDKRVLNLKLALAVPTITLIRVNVGIKNRKTGATVITPFELGLDVDVASILIPISEYRAKSNFVFDTISEITEEVVSIALDGLLTYASIVVAGEAGKRVTDFISIGVETTVQKYGIVDGQCVCLPPDEGCPDIGYPRKWSTERRRCEADCGEGYAASGEDPTECICQPPSGGCPPGSVFNTSTCHCEPIVCPPGTYYNYSVKSCITPTFSCPNGQVKNAAGACIPIELPPRWYKGKPCSPWQFIADARLIGGPEYWVTGPESPPVVTAFGQEGVFASSSNGRFFIPTPYKVINYVPDDMYFTYKANICYYSQQPQGCWAMDILYMNPFLPPLIAFARVIFYEEGVEAYPPSTLDIGNGYIQVAVLSQVFISSGCP